MIPPVLALLLALLLAPSAGAQQPASPAATATAPAAATSPAPAPRPTRVVAGLTLRVDDQEAAAASAVKAAEARGGWFSSFGSQAVTLRVPVAQTDALVADLRGLGDLLERSYQSDDLTAQVVDLESRLQARRKMLDKYLEVLGSASPKAIVQVEREVTQLVAEIEGLEGQLRFLRDRAAFAEVSVSFRYRERQAPHNDGSSSFAWLNTLNLADVLYDLEYGRRADKAGVLAVAPQGFAAYDKPARFQAISPDDVAYRVRSAKHDPQADLPFWTEALRNRMVAAGYHLDSEQTVKSADGSPGVVLELGAANGEQDQTYLVGLFVDGGRLVIVEATGEAERFKARREAILAAIGQITL